MKKIFFQIIGGVSIVFVLVTLFVIVPILNENWVDYKLNPLFEKFNGITTKAYPNKSEREAEFTKVLVEKANVLESDAWPLITCKARFIAQNPGTIHRRDMKEIFCLWGN